MNKWFGCGRLTAEPETRTSEAGKKIAKFRIAVNDRENTIFVPVTAFDKQATFAENYLHKGTKVIVEGRLQLSDYTNKDGVKMTWTDIISDHIEFAESKNAAAANAETTEAPKKEDDFMPIPETLDDDGLPWN